MALPGDDVIFLDKDKNKPLHIHQSIFLSITLVFATGLMPTLLFLEFKRHVNGLGAYASALHIIGMISAKPGAFLLLCFSMFGPLTILLYRYRFWSVYVEGKVLTYRSLFSSRSLQTSDIRRVTGIRGRDLCYNLFLRDGTSIAMNGIGVGSTLDLARFEDEIVCKIPQIEMSGRLFGSIRKHGYTEYI